MHFCILVYSAFSDEETSYGRFLAGLSSHLILSLPGKLCDYFNFTDEKKEIVITSQTPGLSFLLALDEMGFINRSDVRKLEIPLKQHQQVQAVAKVQEYQSLVEEKEDDKSGKPLEGRVQPYTVKQYNAPKMNISISR